MYRLTDTDCIIRISDGASIPPDLGNADRVNYEQWLIDGGVPEPYVAPPLPIPSISKAQALLYLLSIGKFESDVLAAIATITDPTERAVAEIEWNHRQPFKIEHPMFAALGPALGITDMEAAFRIAALL